MSSAPSVPLRGSEREPYVGAEQIGDADPDEGITFTVLLRRRPDARHVDAVALGARPPGEREHLSRDAFAGALGASSDDVGAVEAFARANGLEVVDASEDRRSVVVSGRVGDAAAALGVELGRYAYPGGEYRGRIGPVLLPPELEPLVEGVFGLDDRPQATPHFRIAEPAAVVASFTPLQLASLYRFPEGPTGAGECIGIVELGGGYDDASLQAFFRRLGLAVPTVVAVPVDGGANEPTGEPNGPDAEVQLDIEVAGAVAPAARIAVYFAPNTDQGFVDAVTTAVHDRRNTPSVISISWGGPESTWTAQARRGLDQAFADAAALGVTIFCASGDNGAPDGVADGRAHVDFPASSPHVLGCGGTRLRASGGKISSETVWNGGDAGGATGGGVSDSFALPSWQRSAGVPVSANGGGRIGRGVPDVAGDADPATGYAVEVDGQQLTIGGTSAVAPLWAGLIARVNEQLGKPVGFVNPLLYAGNEGFRDVTSGNNVVAGAPGYSARRGWDACTGLGSPDGEALTTLLAAS